MQHSGAPGSLPDCRVSVICTPLVGNVPNQWQLMSVGVERVPSAHLHGEKWPGCDAQYPPLSTTEFKKKWSDISISPIRLHGVYRDNFTLISTGRFVVRKYSSFV